MAQSGATREALTKEVICNFEISIHSLPTQRKIASILSAYDDLIENNTRRIKILEEMAQMLYREWFVNFRFPNHENVKMVESELGLIPEGWEVKKLGDFGKVVTGKTPSTKNSDYFGDFMPFIKTPSMHGNMFCVEAEEYLSALGVASQKNKTIPANSIIVNCIGALAGSVSITAIQSQTNQQINAVVLNDIRTREFLYFALVDLKETLRQHGSNGATMINVNKNKFESLQVVCPTINLLSRFHDLVNSQLELVKNLQLRNINLRKTRDLLLPKLISGEIDVENLDIETLEIAA